LKDGLLDLDAVVASPDGRLLLRESAIGCDPEKLGTELGEILLRRGGDEILRQVYGQDASLPQQP
jgi:hydroxymethylbilane synthase